MMRQNAEKIVVPRRLLERPETSSMVLSNKMIPNPKFKPKEMIKSDSIFIWVPKCAGTSIYRTLKFRMLKQRRKFSKFKNSGYVTFSHVSLEKLLEVGYVSRTFFNKSFKFCFVRNPWDRMVSLYHYLRRSSEIDFKGFCHIVNRGTRVKKIGLYNTKKFSQTNPQYKWIYDSNMKCMVDFIGRYESLQRDFEVVCQKLGLPTVELPRTNQTEHAHYVDYYDDETRELVRKIYAKDIELFGYEFENKS